MLINADCTVYENGGTAANTSITAKHVLEGVYWNDSRGQTLTKNGVQISDSVVVYIYSGDYVPKAGDLIIKGFTDFEFDGTSEMSMSESMKLFRTMFPDFAVVKSVSDYRYGGLPHIEITAR